MKSKALPKSKQEAFLESPLYTASLSKVAKKGTRRVLPWRRHLGCLVREVRAAEHLQDRQSVASEWRD